MSLYLYNTYTRKKEVFIPLNKDQVGLYSCGPTVYDYVHIGNLRAYIFVDVLRRVLLFNNYKVKHVMNITDVGHLTDDEDMGEEKLEIGAAREKKTVWDIAHFYTQSFKRNLTALNILEPHIWCLATDHIREQIELIKKLESLGYVYDTEEAVYFDTSKYAKYTKLSGQKQEDKIQGARAEVKVDARKKHPADFVLWFKRVGKFANHIMHWSSDWGDGFPGWHIECSSMSMKYLGETLDIHTGGVDHIAVHHTNEIAQSECATGKKFVNYWLHNEFLLINDQKMGKSEHNFFTLQTIIDKQFDPLAFRYLCFVNHYRSVLNFTYESLSAAQNALMSIKYAMAENTPDNEILNNEQYAQYVRDFLEAINNDLDMPKGLAILWSVIKSHEINSITKKKILFNFDKVLGLDLNNIKEIIIPENVMELVEQREKMRQTGDWEASDKIRKDIEAYGFIVEDTAKGYKVKIKK